MGEIISVSGMEYDCMAYVGDHVIVVLKISRLVRVAETSAGKKRVFYEEYKGMDTMVQWVIFWETDKYIGPFERTVSCGTTSN